MLKVWCLALGNCSIHVGDFYYSQQTKPWVHAHRVIIPDWGASEDSLGAETGLLDLGTPGQFDLLVS